MKTTLPHDPLDDLIAAALHGELTPAERTAFELHLQNDPAARAAYQETRLMHDLLEKTHREAQPNPAFEQRMVSGVRRKIRDEEQHRETAWESVVALWRMGRGVLRNRWIVRSGYAVAVLLVLAVGIRTHFRDTALITGMSDQAYAQAKRSMNANVRSSLAVDGRLPNAISVNGAFPDSASNAPRMAPPNSALQTPTDSDNSVAAAAAAASTPAAPIAMDSPEYKKLVQTEEDQLQQSQAPAGSTKVASDYGIVTRNGYQDSDKLAAKSLAIREAGSSWARSPENVPTAPPAPNAPTPDVTRKLIRNAQLDLEVKSFPAAVDQIAALTKVAGGYVDTSNSQRGGNGKLQGTVVVKVLPQNLDDFLLKLRDVGELKNQSVSTEDVTKEYVDTQARLDNARRMETQLQALLARNNGKVSELLMVERELGRVRGEIEQMQGELKLYDFQVEYATVTLSVQEKDLTQAAAYLLKERDEFSLFATNVEATYNQARQAAEACQGHILEADLNHNSGSDISAMLVVSVPPGQIEAFLAQVKTLGRVDNFTRQTQRVPQDGGNTDQPADQTKTENDRVLVHLSIRSDNDSRKQVAMTVVTPAVDDALDKAKTATLASAGAEILSSSINKTPDGPATAQLSVRIPGTSYPALLAAFRTLGRTSSFSLQRDDNAGPNAAGDDAPVILSLTLTDDETPLQRTELSVLSSDDVDSKAQQLKKDAATNGVEIKASSFERTPDGRETAQMTFRLPMAKYPSFMESLKKLGRVESLSVSREDRPDQARTDETAPAEISLQLHNEGEIVAENNGIWATLRETFGDGAAALLGSVRTIGVIVAFLVPWVIALGFLAWVGRRIYVARRK
jgi:anti-sigma factor RsiW